MADGSKDSIALLPSDATGFRMRFLPSEALGWPLVWDQEQQTAIRSPHGGPKISWGGPPVMPRTGKNRMHFELAPPVECDQHAEVDRLACLGAARIDIGQVEVSRTAMADPDGNEFCMLTPR